MRSFMVFPGLLGAFVLGCGSTPTGPLDGQLWVLRTVDGQPLPARPTAFVTDITADTLEFGVESAQWRPRPLARAIRWFGPRGQSASSEEWWYTYEVTNRSTFPIRGLCADGDLAACSDASAAATVHGSTLTIQFRDRGLGRLEYQRIR